MIRYAPSTRRATAATLMARADLLVILFPVFCLVELSGLEPSFLVHGPALGDRGNVTSPYRCWTDDGRLLPSQVACALLRERNGRCRVCISPPPRGGGEQP
jgi:hypothetical protein